MRWLEAKKVVEGQRTETERVGLDAPVRGKLLKVGFLKCFFVSCHLLVRSPRSFLFHSAC